MFQTNISARTFFLPVFSPEEQKIGIRIRSRLNLRGELHPLYIPLEEEMMKKRKKMDVRVHTGFKNNARADNSPM